MLGLTVALATRDDLYSGSVLRPLEELALFGFSVSANIKVTAIVGSKFQDGSHDAAFPVVTEGEVQVGPLPKCRRNRVSVIFISIKQTQL